ncbi:hypothetical protein [Streptomyces afghaniensis]|uniref:hypothetical protein n=1 Tax=Streptomyces afghaniensis TaxID=66865 RepID=UPI00278AE56F|nr:hypothetical protein [Streptomyces afghaniensis]MDQ1018602.1 pimeloyl-ACP methyl ester carboxylesterase [Streptomyces afghaniensis]
MLAATTTVRPDYHRVIGQVIDALGVDRVGLIGLIGLGLGGYYGAESASHAPRGRAGGPEAARGFVRHIGLSSHAPRIACPLLVSSPAWPTGSRWPAWRRTASTCSCRTAITCSAMPGPTADYRRLACRSAHVSRFRARPS